MLKYIEIMKLISGYYPHFRNALKSTSGQHLNNYSTMSTKKRKCVFDHGDFV